MVTQDKKPVYTIAITGLPQVGLSLVADYLKQQQRIAVIDLEAIPLELYLGPNFTDVNEWTGESVVSPNPAYAALRQEFGSDLVNVINGPINRDLLAARINEDETTLRQFHAIVHAGVRTRMLQKLELVKCRIAFVLVPYLTEHNMHNQFQEAWYVACNRPTHIKRVVSARKISPAQARQLITSNHLPQAEKSRNCSYVIDNSAEPALTYAQIRGLLPQAFKRARAFRKTSQAKPTSDSAA